jgi:hypothetical protein
MHQQPTKLKGCAKQIEPWHGKHHHKFTLSQFDNGNRVKLVISWIHVFLHMDFMPL